jgi:hypothetical protein
MSNWFKPRPLLLTSSFQTTVTFDKEFIVSVFASYMLVNGKLAVILIHGLKAVFVDSMGMP